MVVESWLIVLDKVVETESDSKMVMLRRMASRLVPIVQGESEDRNW